MTEREGGGGGGAGGGGSAREGGPVPVRDLMRRMAPTQEAEPDAGAEAAWEETEESFEAEGESWVARAAGAGSYGTGRIGAARLLAVHFFRQADPETPVREALVAAGRFPDLRPEELRSLLESATPIEREE